MINDYKGVFEWEKTPVVHVNMRWLRWFSAK